MLSVNLVTRLSKMPCRPDAELRVSYLPLGSIYWTDEINEIVEELITAAEADSEALLRLFRIRTHLWDGEPLDENDWDFFVAAREQVPDYALFQRLQIQEHELRQHREVKEAAADFWQVFFCDTGEDISPEPKTASLEAVAG